MDRRLLVALALTALVMLVFQLVFPTPTPSAAKLAADSAQRAVAAAQSHTTQANAAQTTGAPTTGPANAPGNTNANGTGTPTAVVAGSAAAADAAIPAETTDVRTAKAIFRMTNVGAAPLGVTMLDFKTLRPGTPTPLVDLGTPGAPMFRYKIITSRDSFDLSTI